MNKRIQILKIQKSLEIDFKKVAHFPSSLKLIQ